MFPYTIGKNTNPYYESQHGANNIIYEVHVTPMYNELSFLFLEENQHYTNTMCSFDTLRSPINTI